MAKCCCCGRDMLKTDSCDFGLIEIEGRSYMPITYGNEVRANFAECSERCHDCNVAKGGYHHPGCDVEECPKCHGQLISCSCLDEEVLQ